MGWLLGEGFWTGWTGKGERVGKESRDIPRQRPPAHIIHRHKQIHQRHRRLATRADFRARQTRNIRLVHRAVDHENHAHDCGADDEGFATAEAGGEEEDEEAAGDYFDGAEDAGEEEVGVGGAAGDELEVLGSV